MFTDRTPGNRSPLSGEALASSSVPPAVEPYSASWTYDAGGNRLTKTVNNVLTSYKYNAQNELETETTDSATTYYYYDRAGNQTSRVEGSAVEEYRYNHANQMSMYIKGGSTHRYLFAPGGERMAKVSPSGSEEWYMYDGSDVAADYVRSSGEASFTCERTYVNGRAIDSKIARIEAGSPESVSFYVGDAIGSVHEMVDAQGAVVRRVLNTAWGEDLPGFTPVAEVADRHGFTQRENDAESGLMHYRARSYDPRLGRFIQNEPILGSRPFEHYAYAGNNPVSGTDPTGLFSMLQIVARMGETRAINLMVQAGWILLYRPSTVVGHGPDAILFHPVEKVLRYVDNKSYHYIRRIGASKLACLTTEFESSQALAKESIAKLGCAETRAAATQAIGVGTEQKVVTTFYGRTVKLDADAAAAGVRVLTKAEVEEAAVKWSARLAEAGAKSAGIFARFGRGALWVARVAGSSVVAVAGFVLMMENSTSASDVITDWMDAEGLLRQLEHKGIPLDKSEVEDQRVDIERLSTRQLETALKIVSEQEGYYFKGDVRAKLNWDLLSEWTEVMAAKLSPEVRQQQNALHGEWWAALKKKYVDDLHD